MADTSARVIAGRYRLMSRLGRGGMGVVWRAHDELLDRDVAIKEIHFPYADTGEPNLVVRRALREARAAAQLKHRGIITVHDVVTADGRPWIVMELIRGRSLHQVITSDGPMPPAAARYRRGEGRNAPDAMTAPAHHLPSSAIPASSRSTSASLL